MSEVQAPGISREITIYATRGGQMQKITTDVTTWGELQPLVRNAGFDLSSLLAAENINKSDLVNDLAVLPATAFRLFLRPKQTKSGSLDRKECFAVIKDHIAIYPEDKGKFTIDGKNVTQLSTPVVQDLVAKYCSVIEKETSIVNEIVASFDSIDNSDLSDIERVQEAIELISSLEDYDSYYKANKHLNNLLSEMSPQITREESDIAREARELGY